MSGGTDVFQIRGDIRVVWGQECGAFVVEYGQSWLAGAGVGVGQVVEAVG
jgi:hypothetical protein